MLSISEPEVEEAMIKEANENQGKKGKEHELECKAKIIMQALEYMNDTKLMEALRPVMKKKAASIQDLKELYNEKTMREQRKKEYALGD
jgi:hypothetical protein